MTLRFTEIGHVVSALLPAETRTVVTTQTRAFRILFQDMQKPVELCEYVSRVTSRASLYRKLN
jgi:hypothetical protein